MIVDGQGGGRERNRETHGVRIRNIGGLIFGDGLAESLRLDLSFFFYQINGPAFPLANPRVKFDDGEIIANQKVGPVV